MNKLLYMRKALELAEEALKDGEVPVGCIVVCADKIVGTGRNRREIGKNALLHAEIEAINEACNVLGGWRLWQCELYVTLEPCPMCAGAIMNARIPRVYYGAGDAKHGALGSLFNLFDFDVNHKPEIEGGIMEDECREILARFFIWLRAEQKRRKDEDVLQKWKNK